MAHALACLIETERGWTFQQPREAATILQLRNAAASDVAATVAASFTTGRRPRSLVILLDARSVLFSRFDLADVGGSRSHSSLAFRLEADLPVSAEDILCDFHIGVGGSVSAVAVDKPQVISLVEELDRQGIRVRSILPATMVVVQELVESHVVPDTCLLTLLDEQSVELLLLDRKAVRSWRLIPAGQNAEQASRLLAATMQPSPPEFVVGSREQLDVWANERGATLIEEDLAQLRSAKACQPLVKQRAWFDLCGDPGLKAAVSGSDNPAFRKLAVLLAGCLLAISAACAWRAERLRAVTQDVREETREVFRLALPEARLPSAVVARLKSEHTKLVASRSAGGQEIPTASAALPILDRVLRGLPQGIEFSVQEIRIQNGEIYVEMDIQNHNDAGVIVAALQQQGLSFAPPNTQDVGDEIQAVLRGKSTLGLDP